MATETENSLARLCERQTKELQRLREINKNLLDYKEGEKLRRSIIIQKDDISQYGFDAGIWEALVEGLPVKTCGIRIAIIGREY